MEAASPGDPGVEVNRAVAAAEHTDPTQASTPNRVVGPGGGPDSPPRGQSPLDADAHDESDPFVERPEVFVGGAFAGGLVLAIILRALGSGK